MNAPIHQRINTSYINPTTNSPPTHGGAQKHTSAADRDGGDSFLARMGSKAGRALQSLGLAAGLGDASAATMGTPAGGLGGVGMGGRGAGGRGASGGAAAGGLGESEAQQRHVLWLPQEDGAGVLRVCCLLFVWQVTEV